MTIGAGAPHSAASVKVGVSREDMKMKHIKKVSKDERPAPAFVWEWPGIAKNAGKPAYVNFLFGQTDSVDPTDINDFGWF